MKQIRFGTIVVLMQLLSGMLLLGMALALALLVPVSGGKPVASLLLESLVAFLRAQSFLLSIL